MSAGVEQRKLPGAPGYFATEEGQILSFHASNRATGTPHALKASFTKRGYGLIVIVVDGKRSTKAVHRLVAIAFHGAPPNASSQVRHLDGDRRNNRPSNLAWGSRADNMADMVRHGRTQRGEKSALAGIDTKTAASVKGLLRQGVRVKDIVAKTGCSRSTVLHIKSGRSWSHIEASSC